MVYDKARTTNTVLITASADPREAAIDLALRYVKQRHLLGQAGTAKERDARRAGYKEGLALGIAALLGVKRREIYPYCSSIIAVDEMEVDDKLSKVDSTLNGGDLRKACSAALDQMLLDHRMDSDNETARRNLIRQGEVLPLSSDLKWLTAEEQEASDKSSRLRSLMTKVAVEPITDAEFNQVVSEVMELTKGLEKK